MTARRHKRSEPLGVVAVGVGACAACCAAPVAGFLTAAGLVSVVGALVFGAIGVAVTAVVVAGFWWRRRRSPSRSSRSVAIVPQGDATRAFGP